MVAGSDKLALMKIFSGAFCAALFLILPAPSPAASFHVPEKLVFDLTWAGIKAGTASLEVIREDNRTRIVSTAKSADWVSIFYKVDDLVETVLSRPQYGSAVGTPLNYRMIIREGRHRRNKEVLFDGPNHRALFTDHRSGEKKNIAIGDNTLDPLSSFYYIRSLKTEVGKSLYVDILDNKKLWNVEVLVLRKERINTKLGDFDTIVIKPLLKSEGIFYRKGEIFIWLTDDEKRLPVKMQTRVAVGSITATLTGGRY